MEADRRRILLEGRPGTGKTTVARRLLSLLKSAGVTVGGFTSAELREGGQRVGFSIEAVDGPNAVLARVGWTSEFTVGRARDPRHAHGPGQLSRRPDIH